MLMYMYANTYICVTTYTALEADVTDSIIKQPNPILDLMKVVPTIIQSYPAAISTDCVDVLPRPSLSSIGANRFYSSLTMARHKAISHVNDFNQLLISD